MSWDDPPSTKQEFGSEKQKEFEGRQKKHIIESPKWLGVVFIITLESQFSKPSQGHPPLVETSHIPRVIHYSSNIGNDKIHSTW